MNLCFLGGGNMATALIGGLLESSGKIQRIHIIEPESDTRRRLLEKFQQAAQKRKIELSTDRQDCPKALIDNAAATWIVLAVKPQQMQQACVGAAESLRQLLSKARLLSVAAGVSTGVIKNWCNNSQIIRAMPNMPALVNRGVTGLFADSSCSAADRAEAEQLMATVGKTVWIKEEHLMDAVTALSGSGPAYVFRFIEALTAAGESLGLSKSQSGALALETIKGAIALLESSGGDPAALREKVTSKGGTTAAALAQLDQDRFMEIIQAALIAARNRGAEMGREFR
jgi:pyrroline-5-carboxylate reductase